MRRLTIILALVSSVLFETKALAQKAVLIEDAPTTGMTVEKPASKDDSAADFTDDSGSKVQTKRGSFLREKKSVSEIFNASYDSTYSMRADRRVGLGVQAAGQLGLFGVNAELNFALDDSALIGFGGGPQYSSFEAGWRHVFGGRSLAPYAGATYSRWYNNSSTGSSIGDTTPGFLGQKFLTGGQHNTGQFGVNILTPSAGLQYNMLSGDYVGTSIYAEIMMLTDVDVFQAVVTGAFGATYYF